MEQEYSAYCNAGQGILNLKCQTLIRSPQTRPHLMDTLVLARVFLDKLSGTVSCFLLE